LNLADILEGLSAETALPGELSIGQIRNRAEQVEAGDVYAAIRGTKTDGHELIPIALERGAAAVVTDHDLGRKEQIIVPDTRKAWALMSANFFGHPSRKLRMIGVTGTNGKTSVTTMLKRILDYSGVKTGLIGTIQAEYGEHIIKTQTTTPDAFELQKLLSFMAEDGCEAVVMEVSSHGLRQERLYGCQFEIGVFTNLSQDHLDYHRDMEDYYEAKRKLFDMCSLAVVNLRDGYGRRLLSEITIPKVTFSAVQPEADFSASEITCKREGVSFRLRHQEVLGKVAFAIPGFYSVENALAAMAAGAQLGVGMKTMITALGEIPGIRGRSEVIYHSKNFTVICDYAHTPDGILNVLSTLRECAQHRLVVLFGCGGDRDHDKRPLMAKACERYADFIIVTSDNPRSENPEKIISEILPGFSENAEFTVVTDREEAIAYGINHAKPGDTFVLLGKGHETYQIIREKTIPFDERRIVKQVMEQKGCPFETET
jgi:UDP-N-acetylmuramoyl-L-alanyl-D-glutamate--2,6-diaminopimelate ligase